MNNTALNLFLPGILFGSGPCMVSCGPIFLSLLYGPCLGIGASLSPLAILMLVAGLILRLLMQQKAIYQRIISFLSGAVIISLGIQLMRRAF